jgi:membrane protein DedA with SNARE-associated domain
MTGKIIIPKKFYYILLTSIVAICLVSFTFGRELYEGKTESFFSFGLIHFSGYLFFLLMPVELAFVYYLPFYSEIDLLAAALGTAIVAQSIDYFIGKLIRPKRIIEIVGIKRIVKVERYIKKYGLLAIFVFNLFPLSSPIISLVSGMVKINFRYFIFVSFMGLVLKYVVLILCFS